MLTSSQAVKSANKASASTLARSVSASYDIPSLSPLLQVLHSSHLNQNQRDSVWRVFEDNMYSLYKNSAFGWDPDSKRKELFDKLSRFILVYKEGSTELLAFVMFRFEFEVDEDVIYCYDIQVASSAQGVSLGRRLIGELETLCRMYKMKKIMLTVLKANSRALEFYKAVGFTMDRTSPDYVDSDAEEESEFGSEQEIVDYEILSKLILP